jgi:hypothetical protein
MSSSILPFNSLDQTCSPFFDWLSRDCLRADVECCQSHLFERFAPRAWNETSAHLLKRSLAVAPDNSVNRCRGADIVARLEVRWRRLVNKPVKLHQLAPTGGYALHSASAVGTRHRVL